MEVMKRSLWGVAALALLLGGVGQAPGGVIVTPLVTDVQLTNIQGITNDGVNLYVTISDANPQSKVLSVPIGGGSITQLYSYSGQPPSGVPTPWGITVLGL